MNAFDVTWERIHQTNAWGKYPSEDVIRFMARNYYQTDRNQIKVLDLGCGAGSNTWYLARERFDTYAIDGSETAISKTKELLSSMNLKAHLQVSDAAILPFNNGYFDVIIDSAVIYTNQVEGIEQIVKECKRVLKKGGKIFSTGNFNSKTTGFGTGHKLESNTYQDLTEGPLADRGTIHFFEKEELLNLYDRLGFSNIKIDHTFRTEHDQKLIVSYFILQAENI